MKKYNYVSEELEQILINDFILNNEESNDGVWFDRLATLYKVLIRLFKYQIENNNQINFDSSLEYLLENYQILKNKKLYQN